MINGIEKFKQEMKRGIRGIDVLVYVLEGGLEPESGSTVSDLLRRYLCADIIKKAFDDLEKTVRLLKGGWYVANLDKAVVKIK